MSKAKKWVVAAAVRAVKTAAQTLVTLIGADMVSIVALDWPQMLAVAATTAIVSLLTSVAGIPEVEGGVSAVKLFKEAK